MDASRFRAWITKNGLLSNVFIVEAFINPHTSDMIETDTGRNYWGEGSVWHRTRDGAIQYIELLRQEVIRSYQRRIKEIEDLIVEVPE